MSSTADSATTRRRGKQTPDEPYANGEAKSNVTISPAKPQTPGSTSTTLSILQIWAPTLLLIFGGCCSNVYTLESLISASPTSGTLLTFVQFLLVSLFTLPHHISLSAGPRNLFLKERNIPLRKWIIYTAYFLTINILNNVAFRYKIGIPLHIILRSAGPVTTMLAGRVIKGRRYPVQKVIAVVLLFSGVVLAAFSDAAAKQADVKAARIPDEKVSTRAGGGAWSQAPGFALLASALILSACMGLYVDDMYATHGRSGDIAAETLFYSHAMSLPYFLSQVRPLFFEFFNLMAIPDTKLGTTSKPSTSPLSPASLLDALSTILPHPVWLLAANAATQLFCIIGVNRLSAQSSSLTVSIVLNIRKLTSLVLSIMLFGNSLPLGVMIGAAVVFLGGGLYALPVRDGKPKEKVK
ncbi:golgi uridine diphosphate-N- acetylglucosamine transporter [Cladophialophora chaetospira]|uniref:Golgi uridine diphosphate-N- acetylglucosamine transporter n=1 Tax=Cladophialophora chaetospira TaxID=386627 RepID=A0AA39CPW3_9EURO|nr:golgi uridine diphosphate-N- acetylglucosamine transporter [Cladophialophora chaetospira]